jgi:hypothetical protein
VRARYEFTYEARLADPGRADDRHQLRLGLIKGITKRALKALEFCLTADEG